MREIVLDTETTGLSPKEGHRIVEIGALEMRNKVLTGEKFHFYINPERDMPESAYRIHGISSEFLRDKPLFSDIADDFLTFIKDATLVIHNARFDINFINHEFSLLKIPPLNLSDAIDTLPMARKKFPGAKANLDALCKRFKIDNTAREYHGALLDAELLAEVYVELTGGRQESFSMVSKDLSKVSDEDKKEIKVLGNGLVISPTKIEIEQHQKFIERFAK